MFFILSKLLAILLNPLFWIIGPAIVGIIRLSRKLLLLSIAVLVIFSNPLLIGLLVSAWEFPPSAPTRTYSVGVVLTGMTIPALDIDKQVQFGESAERFIEAVRLYHAGKISKILISGGSGTIGRPELAESPALRGLAIELRVPPKDVFIDDRSRNTYENATYSLEQLEMLDLAQDSVLLITSATHMRRALACFQKQGIKSAPYAVDFNTDGNVKFSYEGLLPTSSALILWSKLLHEWVGYLVYSVVGYL